MIRVRSLDAAFGSGAGPKKDMLSHLHSLCPVFGRRFKFIFTGVDFPLIFRPIGPGACIPIIPSTLLSVFILMGLLATWDTILNSHLEEAKHNCHGWLPLFSPPAWSHFSFLFSKNVQPATSRVRPLLQTSLLIPVVSWDLGFFKYSYKILKRR